MKTPQEIFTDRMTMLSVQDKQQVRDFVSSKLFETYLRAVSAYKPSANCGNAGSGSRDEFSNDRAASRLSEMRGWELHEAALHGILYDAEKPDYQPEPEYPDSGQMISPAPPAETKRRKPAKL